MRKVTLILALAFFSGCATITTGSRQDITIYTKPENAKVFINGNKVGEGTCTVEVQKKKKNTIIVKADGYETAQIRTNRQVRAGYAVANIGMCFIPMVNFFGIPSLIVDACTGAWMIQDEDEYHFDLEKK
jgi:hypothetical protein